MTRVEKQTGSADNAAKSRKFHIPNNFLPNNIVQTDQAWVRCRYVLRFLTAVTGVISVGDSGVMAVPRWKFPSLPI